MASAESEIDIDDGGADDMAGLNVVAAPFTQILFDADDGEDDMGGADDGGVDAAGAAAVAAAPLPAFADAHLLPAYQLRQTTVSSFKNNPDYLLHLRENGDGLLAAASSCRAIKIYDRTLSFLSALEGHSEIITDLCFVPTVSAALLSCSEDGNLMCFDAKNNKVISKLKGIGGKSLYCCASNGQLMVAGGEAGICFWDIRSQNMLGSFEEFHTQDVLQLKFHPRRPSRLFSGGEDGLIAEFDLLQNDPDEAVETIMNVEQSVGKIGFFGAQAEYLYCLSQINTMSMWNIAESEPIATLPAIRANLSTHMQTDYLIDCHWNAATSSLFLASGDTSGRMLLSHLGDAGVRPVRALGGAHVGVTRDVCWSGDVLYTCGEDARLCAWAAPAPPAAGVQMPLDLSLPKPVREESAEAAARRPKKFSPY